MRLLDRTEVRARFAATLAECEAPAPWYSTEHEPGVIRDADHNQVALVDELHEPTAARIALLICIAVNVFAQQAAREEAA